MKVRKFWGDAVGFLQRTTQCVAAASEVYSQQARHKKHIRDT